ncbi:MAG: serine hydrolase [Candidatus Latescibacteria bacterium]|nr:serine hydrolase [Candidatus Latescibacterota bacterium]
MKTIALLGLTVWLNACATGPTPNKLEAPPLAPPLSQDGQLLRASPESQGISSAAILDFVEYADTHIDALHSIMLLRHGRVVAEGWWPPYAAEHPHQLFSLSKSFTSTAIGMAIEEGLLEIDDPVLKFFPEDAPAEPSDNLKALRIRQLLSMATGHTEDSLNSFFGGDYDSWEKAFLDQPVDHQPGTLYLYDSGATYMLSSIITKVSGQSLLEYLQPRLFAPLGIADPTWLSVPPGINTGGWGLKIKTEDIARFGQLYLQRGQWRGRQLVSEAWIEEATLRQMSNGSDPESDWAQGYGYKFWLCRHDAYRADGAFGQFSIVMPEQDAVLAITSGAGDTQQVLDAVWDHLLPAMQAAPLAEDPDTQEKLTESLAGLAFAPQQGEPTSPMAARVSGKKYTFTLDPDDWREAENISFSFSDAGTRVTFTDARGTQEIASGYGQWVQGRTQFGDLFQEWDDRAVAASGAWTAPDTYVLQLCFYETPFMATITCQFTDAGLLYDYRAHVDWGDPKRPQLVGRVD